jgi:hypothetical protein
VEVEFEVGIGEMEVLGGGAGSARVRGKAGNRGQHLRCCPTGDGEGARAKAQPVCAAAASPRRIPAPTVKIPPGLGMGSCLIVWSSPVSPSGLFIFLRSSFDSLFEGRQVHVDLLYLACSRSRSKLLFCWNFFCKCVLDSDEVHGISVGISQDRVFV